ncbi:MAG: hypothetical protein DRO01_04920, partial [Thermoproteota archaeon]
GTYVENVDVYKRITLSGDGADVVTVRAADAGDHVFNVTASYVNIRGFTVTGATDDWTDGIYLYNVDHCNISENNVSDNYSGICLSSSSDNTLTGNTANSNGCYGIYIEDSSNNTLTNNIASYNRWNGIYIEDSSNNTLTDNTANSNWYGYGVRLWESGNNAFTKNAMAGNKYNFGIRGDGFSHYIQNIDTSNKVDGKPIYYWTNRQDQQVPDDAGFIGVINSTNMTVRDLVLTKNSEGLLFVFTNNSNVVNVSVSNNYYGIHLISSSNNTIASNTASSNRDSSIYLEYSSNNTLINNNASNNDKNGIYLGRYSNNNTLMNNIASNNGNEGIYLFGRSNNNTLQDNTVSNNDEGIYLKWDSNNNTLTNNTANSNHYGICIASSNNTLTSNTASDNYYYGIYIDGSSNNLLNNTMSGNKHNFGVDDGWGRSHYTQNIDTSNTVDGKPIYYWVDQQDKVIPGDAGFVGVVNSTNITVRDMALTDNIQGVLFAYTRNSWIDNVSVSDNWYGIHLYSSDYNMLTSNIANSNNYCGICLRYSNNNIIYHNNLINNTNHNAYDEYFTNQWDSGSEGNYWSDYTGNDTNRDGIGDDPYDIPGGTSVDRYPLTGIRWLPPEISSSRLGINTHWYKWAEDFPAYKEKIRNFGIIRDGAWWYDLETSDLTGSEWDNANWDYPYNMETFCGRVMTYQSGYDNLVKLYQDEDSPELLMLLNQDNDNISSSDTITYDQYYDYVYHIVERYDGDGVDDMPGLIKPVRYFEVGNEVDYGRTTNPNHDHISPKDYVEKRLIPAYNAAKSANKDAVILCAGLGMGSDLCGNDGQEFNTMYFDAMYDNITKNGGNKNNNFYMDKVAIHYYAKPNAEFDENIKKVEDVIRKYENRDKPIWITEFFPLTEIGPPDTTTGAYSRLLTLMFANKIEMPIIYSLKGEHNVTCVGDEETITPRESLQVIDTVLSTLHTTTPSDTENEDISVEPGKTIYQRVFNNSGKNVTVLWYIDTADPGAVTNCVIFPESPQTFTVDVLGTANFSQTSPLHLTIGSEPTYVVETDLPIDLDIYFNKTTAAGVSTERATSFRVGDTLYGRIKTSTSTNHTVKTYITMTMPDGTCRYAYYDKPDFVPGSDKLLFSNKKVPLYDDVWHATTNDWLWNIYEFTGGDSGIYRWNCWYEDAETGEILGGDSTEYTFSETPSGTPVDSATGGGAVYLDSSAGTIGNIDAIPPDEMPEVPESLNPVYGFFSFNITGLSSGESVNIPLAFPHDVP